MCVDVNMTNVCLCMNGCVHMCVKGKLLVWCAQNYLKILNVNNALNIEMNLNN